MMKKRHFLLATFFITLIGCTTVPVTGRRQLDIVPDSQMLALSFQSYSEFLSTNKLSKDAQATALVKEVGRNIQRAVENYMAQNNLSEQLNGYQWEFNLIESDDANAWAMPGGKVVVYTGILKYTKDVNGLAVVMGHEVAHAVAKHGNERMSQGLVQQLGGVALSVALKDKPQQTQELFLNSYGVGSTLGVLKYSRVQESEADRLGLIFMAMAGYNPEGAIEFWKRMAEQDKGVQPPVFLSTHPSNEQRIADIKRHLPEANRYYKK